MQNNENIFYIHKQSAFKRYLIGIIVIFIVLFVNIIIRHFFSDFIPMTLFLGPVVIAAWLGGRGVGIFVTLFGTIIENAFYSKASLYSFSDRTEIIRALVYIAQGILISLVFGEVHRIQKMISIREEQLSEALRRERKNLIEKEEMLEQLYQTQQSIIAERHKAEDSNALKSLFLAHMSHEIRTPLVSVLGFAELLKEPDLSIENAKKYGSIIERTGNNLLDIINDILDLSKVEAGHLEVEKIPFSIQNLLWDIQSNFLTVCHQKEIRFEIIPQGPIPTLIVSDPTRLRQILLNLIGNAIKFTEKGFVEVKYFIQDNSLVFAIRDSGIGISNDQQMRLFESYKQADSSIARRYAGTGLGLSLSKKLSYVLGGDIQLIESQPNLGSQFQLKISFEEATEKDIQAESQKAKPSFSFTNELQKNKTILLVDDSIDNQFLVQTILAKWGLQVVLASNGKEALEKVKKEKFNLILMDMQMPIMDGYTACAQLIEESCQIPIVALTANAMKEDRDRCLQAGCKDYLSKPIQKIQLLHMIQKNI